MISTHRNIAEATIDPSMEEGINRKLTLLMFQPEREEENGSFSRWNWQIERDETASFFFRLQRKLCSSKQKLIGTLSRLHPLNMRKH